MHSLRSSPVTTVFTLQVAHLRKVYFSMCIEADQLLGSIIDAFRRSSSFDDAYASWQANSRQMLGSMTRHAIRS